MFLKYLSVQFVFGDGVMGPSLLPEHIAVIGLCIFVALSYLLAALFGLLLVREEFAPIWADTRFTCSIAYLVSSLANILALALFTVFSRGQKPPETPSSTSEERGGEQAEEKEEREEEREEEKGVIQEAEELLQGLEQ